MRTRLITCLTLAGLLLIGNASAWALAKTKASDVVVTATKIEKSVEHLTDSVTVINEKQLKEGGFTDMTEALRFTPSVDFKQAGGPGQFNYPKLRGFGNGHFMVLIDGMKVNDAMSPGVGHMLGHIDPFIIERVEVLRGPQSVLYGSDSTAGLFAFTTKGGLPGANLSAGAQYGSLSWKKGYAGIRGQADKLKYSLNFAYTDSDGVLDEETYTNQSPQLKLSYDFTDNFSAEASFLYIKSKFNFAQLDEAYGSPYWGLQTPDPENYNQAESYLGVVNFKHKISDALRQKLTLGWYQKENENKDAYNGFLGYQAAPVDNFTLDYMNYYQKGQRVPVYDSGDGKPSYNKNTNTNIDYNFIVDSQLGGNGLNTLLLGVEYLEQKGEKWGKYGEADGTLRCFSLYANDQVMLLDEALVLSGGLRADDYNEFGNQLVGKVGAAYTFKSSGTTPFINYGTSFRAPSVAQLYDPKYGNTDLNPEKGWTVEGGLRQEIMDGKIRLEATTWYTELDDVVVWESTGSMTGSYVNRDQGKSQGVELVAGWQILPSLYLSANYTYTDSRSEKGGVESRTVQIPRNKFNLNLAYDFNEKLHLSVHGMYVDQRLGWNGFTEMDSYWRWDAAVRYELAGGLALFGRAENLFDKEYNEGTTYEQPGFYGVIGLEWDFDLSSLGG